MKASGIILAGGRSSRMGCDKTLLSVHSETMIERTVRELRKSVDEIIIASNDQSKYNIPGTLEVRDIYPGMGPLAGIHAGLLAASHPYAFVVAGDMPFFSAELVSRFIELCQGYDAAAPFINGQWEPLCAVYSRECIKPIEQALINNRRNVYQVLPEVNVLKVSEKELNLIGARQEVFCNMNTPDDYARILQEKTEAVQ